MTFTGELPKGNKPLIIPKLANGHWKFPEQMGKGVGFIYVIRDPIMGKFYLGKKMYYGMGKVNRGKESNWRSYRSSSKLLKELFVERPLEEFEFICLEQYQTKGTLSYSETWSLCQVEAPTSDDWYNRLVEKVCWPVKEPISIRHKKRLEKVISWEPFDDE